MRRYTQWQFHFILASMKKLEGMSDRLSPIRQGHAPDKEGDYDPPQRGQQDVKGEKNKVDEEEHERKVARASRDSRHQDQGSDLIKRKLIPLLLGRYILR